MFTCVGELSPLIVPLIVGSLPDDPPDDPPRTIDVAVNDVEQLPLPQTEIGTPLLDK
jgi:hypothetical protein